MLAPMIVRGMRPQTAQKGHFLLLSGPRRASTPDGRAMDPTSPSPGRGAVREPRKPAPAPKVMPPSPVRWGGTPDSTPWLGPQACHVRAASPAPRPCLPSLHRRKRPADLRDRCARHLGRLGRARRPYRPRSRAPCGSWPRAGRLSILREARNASRFTRPSIQDARQQPHRGSQLKKSRCATPRAPVGSTKTRTIIGASIGT